MSVATVITASGTVTSTPAVLFGLTVSVVGAAAPTPPPTDVATVSVYDGTSASGTKVAEVSLAALNAPDAKMHHTSFPAGLRCSKGIHVVVTGNGHSVAVSVDFS